MFRTARPHRATRSHGGTPTASHRRRAVGAAAALVLGVSVLTGCAAGRISQTADQIANLGGAQGTVGQVGVRNALLATPDGTNYAKGSTAPLELWISNDADHPDTLTGITTDVGTVSIDGTATIPGGSIIEIGGADSTVTATVTDLTRELNYGISIPMTFSFAHAGDLQLNIPIKNPEERSTPRSTVNIRGEEPPNVWETTPETTTPAPTTSQPAEEHEAPPTQGHFYTHTVANTPNITG